MKMSNVYYGTDKPEHLTYLEFGAIDLANSKKNIWGYHLHQQAYDWFMLARYANDIAVLSDLTESLPQMDAVELVDACTKQIHHHDMLNVHLRQLCAICTAGKEFFELGQTLMGCIDGLEFLDALFNHFDISINAPQLDEVEWIGADISPLFNTLSKKMHPSYSVTTALPEDAPEQYDVFYARGVTLMYAIKAVSDLMTWVTNSGFALFDCSFSTGESCDKVIPTGKNIHYPALHAFVDAHNKSGRSLFFAEEKEFHPSDSGLICVNCISGDQAACSMFLELEANVRQQLDDANLSNAFISLKSGGLDWVPAEDFMRQLETKA